MNEFHAAAAKDNTRVVRFQPPILANAHLRADAIDAVKTCAR